MINPPKVISTGNWWENIIVISDYSKENLFLKPLKTRIDSNSQHSIKSYIIIFDFF